ncbi:DUF1127 domain-containing protein [Salipiger bermudensis]|uniref:DUF1127 domain-containing protein n=1 Tax=Salipiger bermudensis TaxID=344736 RepID=UPI001CD66964|nr:DUF1127 domain-containing protein [Salipiger bermudensis]MCA0962017.1 DUF1127 domain-containing protein [Salipiger bermudensis]
MAHVTEHSVHHGLGAQIHAAIAAVRHWNARRNEFARIYDELSRCSDRELADINVARSQIPEIARSAALAV